AWLAANVAAEALGSGSLAGGLIAGVKGLAAAGAGYAAADLFSGFLHHWIDNYPTYQSPVVGDVAYEFQVHHHKVHDLEAQSIWTNMGAAGKFVWAPMVAAAAMNVHPVLQAVTLGFAGGCFLAQGSHRWTHMKNPPAIAGVLQKLHLMQSREQHEVHHRMPWSDNYCIVNGMWNPVLTRTNFFRKWEKLIYDMTGKEPNTWRDAGVKALALGQISQEEYLKSQVANRDLFREKVKGEFDAEFERRQLRNQPSAG
ncbi:MAG: fatty acid desaturase CarF family protein, partial [Candidatus Eremiobacterota bacterium]